MKVKLALFLLAAGAFVSCTSNAPYRASTDPERAEQRRARFDVYPEDVRKNPSRYIGATVAWAGIIRSSDVSDDAPGGKIRVDSVIEHHYFDWEQDNHPSGIKLVLSPRGEGLFKVRWYLNRTAGDATDSDAREYAAPGKLAIVYGAPESVADDGTIILKYHFARVLGQDRYVTNEIDYGRLGEPFRPIGARRATH